MTHEELLRFPIYQNACFESQAMCYCLVNHIKEKYGLRPTESKSGYLQWTPNFALIQTLGVRAPNLTINFSGDEAAYRGIGMDDLIRPPRSGLTRLRCTNGARVADLMAATARAYAIRTHS